MNFKENFLAVFGRNFFGWIFPIYPLSEENGVTFNHKNKNIMTEESDFLL